MYTAHRPSYRFFELISGARALTISLLFICCLSACTGWLPDAHKLDITQGNAITPDQVAGLYTGMPKAEVRATLGVPVLQDPFHDQRWDYIFRYIPGKDSVKQSRLTLHFEDDILKRIDDSEYIDPDKMLPPPKLEN